MYGPFSTKVCVASTLPSTGALSFVGTTSMWDCATTGLRPSLTVTVTTRCPTTGSGAALVYVAVSRMSLTMGRERPGPVRVRSRDELLRCCTTVTFGAVAANGTAIVSCTSSSTPVRRSFTEARCVWSSSERTTSPVSSAEDAPSTNCTQASVLLPVAFSCRKVMSLMDTTVMVTGASARLKGPVADVSRVSTSKRPELYAVMSHSLAVSAASPLKLRSGRKRILASGPSSVARLLVAYGGNTSPLMRRVPKNADQFPLGGDTWYSQVPPAARVSTTARPISVSSSTSMAPASPTIAATAVPLLRARPTSSLTLCSCSGTPVNVGASLTGVTTMVATASSSLMAAVSSPVASVMLVELLLWSQARKAKLALPWKLSAGLKRTDAVPGSSSGRSLAMAFQAPAAYAPRYSHTPLELSMSVTIAPSTASLSESSTIASTSVATRSPALSAEGTSSATGVRSTSMPVPLRRGWSLTGATVSHSRACVRLNGEVGSRARVELVYEPDARPSVSSHACTVMWVLPWKCVFGTKRTRVCASDASSSR